MKKADIQKLKELIDKTSSLAFVAKESCKANVMLSEEVGEIFYHLDKTLSIICKNLDKLSSRAEKITNNNY